MLFKSTLAAAAAASSLVGAFPVAAPPPTGGINASVSSPMPEYRPFSDFDFQSLNLALNQEWIELDLFNYGIARFSPEEFEAVGITPADQSLIQFMAQ